MAGGALGALRVARPGFGQPVSFVILCAIAGAGLGYGAAALIDVRFDTSPPQTIRTTVSSMYVSRGRGASYYLRLPAWGPRTGPNSVSVSSDLYDRLNPGDPVCIDLRRGALSASWFVVHACPLVDMPPLRL